LAKNKLKEIREQMLLSKAELARKAGVSPMTIDRIENAENCRMETMRKVLVALDISLEDRGRVFPDLT
jgi:DNA-binding XRE family transcriptional regulator